MNNGMLNQSVGTGIAPVGVNVPPVNPQTATAKPQPTKAAKTQTVAPKALKVQPKAKAQPTKAKPVKAVKSQPKSQPVKMGVLATGHEVTIVRDEKGGGATLRLGKSRKITDTAHYKFGDRAFRAARKLVKNPEMRGRIHWLAK